ncbi:DUF6320 domain-containing protein [Oscillibacter sp.]|uniref:DUF6320 domain-containing protein n=1 Tax=Oscillibacter sp. TaxID=1945593 RepID=UPI00261A6C24|nr:DUF6320 domain-containing protein [Oscillibacter sp.]MDD3346175.1 DUF6320 domain-containing protein [Oscillibacter sp.]
MPYCVNCGVELNPGSKSCPLCKTPAWQPEAIDPPYFPTKPAEVALVSKRMLALIVTCMLVSVGASCGLVNLILPTERPWSLYVIGAVVMLWIWLVLPMLLRRMPTFLRLTLDVAAIGIYVYLISLDLNGTHWFRALALPLLGVCCAVVFLLSFLLRGNRRSRLSAISLTIGAAGLMALGTEFFTDRYLHGAWDPGWSLATVVICVALIIPLRIIRHVPSLRNEVRRRFSL